MLSAQFHLTHLEYRNRNAEAESKFKMPVLSLKSFGQQFLFLKMLFMLIDDGFTIVFLNELNKFLGLRFFKKKIFFFY